MLRLTLILFVLSGVVKVSMGALANYWPIQNNTYKDIVGGKDLTSSAPTVAQDRFGNNGAAIRVTSNSNYFQLPSSSYFQNSLTISVWMITYANTNSYARILDCGNGGNAYNVILCYSYGSSAQPYGSVYYGIGGSFTGYVLSSITISNNIWYHFAMVVNTTSLLVYINGMLVATGGLTSPVVSATRSQCYIGKSNWGDTAANSDYDDIKFYNTALSQSNIITEYNNGTSLFLNSISNDFYSSLTNYWPINGSTVDVVSGADLDSFNPTFTTDRFGNAGGAITVTNKTNFFWAPHGYYFNTTGYSVTCWFKVYSASNAARVFDFGNGQAVDNFFLSYSKPAITPTIGFVYTYVSYSNTLSLNTWYHVGYTSNGTTGVLYVNGVLSSVISTPHTISRVQRWINYFGKSGWSGDPASNADFDDIKFFDTTLTQQQVIYDYLTNSTPYTTKTIVKPTTPYTSPSFYSNMINYWPINQDYKDYVSDYHLNPTSTPVFVNDRFANTGSAYRTNSSNYFSAPPGVYFDTQLTIIGWANAYNPTDSTSLFNFGNGNNKAGVVLGINTNPFFCVYDVYGSGLMSSACSTVSSGFIVPGIKWMHYALAVTSNSAKIYINGVLRGSATLNDPVPKMIRTNCYIGRGGSSVLNGEIDQVKIFNSTLTADQILYDFETETSSFMNSMDTSFYNSLVSYWPGNGSVMDVVGGKNLTGSPSYTQDRYNAPSNAFQITSSSNILQAPTGTYFATEFAITAWVYVNSMGSQNQRILDFGTGSTDPNIILTYTSSSASSQPYFYLTLNDSSYSKSSSPYPITSNYWNHFALSVTSTKASLYINSIWVASSTLAKPIKVVERTQNYFGYSSSDGSSNIVLDEIKFFGQALTHKQIVYDYLTNSTPYIPYSGSSDTDSNEFFILLQNGYDITDCSGNCSNHGSCYKKAKTLLCLCDTNYTGSSCEINLDPCSSSPCLNNGTCVANMTNINATSYVCECASSYYGGNCQLQVDLCANITCSGNGACQTKGSEHVCNCFYLYSGDNCEIMSDKKKIITQVVSASSIIAIIIIFLLYALLLLIDLDNLYRNCRKARRPQSRKRVYRLFYTP